MSSTQKIAIAAHLHVLLRRKIGRVTYTEHEDHPESGFMESAFGSFFSEGAAHEQKKQRDPEALLYVRGLRQSIPCPGRALIRQEAALHARLNPLSGFLGNHQRR